MINSIINLIFQSRIGQSREGAHAGLGSGYTEAFISILQAHMDANSRVTNTSTQASQNMLPLLYLNSAYTAPRVISTTSGIGSSPSQYDDMISTISQKYGMDPALVKAVVNVESSFDSTAISRSGAMGLMQLMPGTAEGLGVEDPFDPVQNIDGGVRYLKQQLGRYNGDVKLALAAYNCGPGRVKSLGVTNLDDPVQLAKLPRETQNYVGRVLDHMKTYKVL